MREQPDRVFDVVEEGPVTRVTFLCTRLDDSKIPALGELYALVARPNQAELHLDFTGVAALSSTALGKLLRLRQRAVAAGSRLLLTNLDPFVHDLFRVTRLDTILEIRPEAADGPVARKSSA